MEIITNFHQIVYNNLHIIGTEGVNNFYFLTWIVMLLGLVPEYIFVTIINIYYKKDIKNYFIIYLLLIIPLIIMYVVDVIPYSNNYIPLAQGTVKLFIYDLITIFMIWFFSFSSIMYLYNKFSLKKVMKLFLFISTLVILEIPFAVIEHFHIDNFFYELFATCYFYFILFIRPLLGMLIYIKESRDI